VNQSRYGARNSILKIKAKEINIVPLLIQEFLGFKIAFQNLFILRSIARKNTPDTRITIPSIIPKFRFRSCETAIRAPPIPQRKRASANKTPQALWGVGVIEKSLIFLLL
jgi:hypothetical protein